MVKPRLFVFGLGYTSLALTRGLMAEGWRIAGTCRTQDKAEALKAQGVEAFVFERGQTLPNPADALAGATHILSSVPPDESGDPVLDQHSADLRGLQGVQWAGYLSTTGVYGDHGGGWVDEATPTVPTSDRSVKRLGAEKDWLALGLPVHIFRLAGIYGPGRSALDQVRAGTARRIDKPGQFFSRIHVDDIVHVLRASIRHPNPGAVYNIADDEPAPSHEVVGHACCLLDADLPPLVPFEKASLSPMAASFYADNKRVRNDRLKQELGVRLLYPSYREGLDAQYRAENTPN